MGGAYPVRLRPPFPAGHPERIAVVAKRRSPEVFVALDHRLRLIQACGQTPNEGRRGEMSDLTRLIQDLSTSQALQARLEQVGSIEAAVVAAGEAGYRITPEEVAAYLRELAQRARNEMSDTQLDAVSGGKSYSGDGQRINAWQILPVLSPAQTIQGPINEKTPLPPGMFIRTT
jgi:predicted ribosomally synthesized peptide with nif11-like leader